MRKRRSIIGRKPATSTSESFRTRKERYQISEIRMVRAVDGGTGVQTLNPQPKTLSQIEGTD
jgi:hypothetical protein